MSYKEIKNYLAGWGLILGAAIGTWLFIMTGSVYYLGGAGIGLVFGAMAQTYLSKEVVNE